MNKTFNVFLLSLMLLLSACDKPVEQEKTDPIRPVKTMLIESLDSDGIRYFPGHVDASKKAKLAFRVSGKLKSIAVKEGDDVNEGELIASLEPRDFKISLSDKQASFDRAKKDFTRAKRLVKEGHISKLDFDKLESSYIKAKADLNLAKQQLSYTQLKAPFKGTIAKLFVDNFEQVQANQNILTLNNSDVLDIKINVPENLFLSIKPKSKVESIEQSKAKYDIPVSAIFQSGKQKEYALRFKEIATQADEKSQTYAISYSMARPDDLILLPGMTTKVKVDLRGFLNNNDESIYLPLSAVMGDSELKGQVWVVDQSTNTVMPRRVKVGSMKGNQIQILEGLKQGERIVIAGVPFLYSGLKVRLMQEHEQARDNLPHARPNLKAQDKTIKATPSGE